MVNLARRMIAHDWLRFAITITGVGFAVTLVLVQVGLFQGILSYATVSIERASADLWVTPRSTPNVDFTASFSETLVNRVRSVEGVARADNLIVMFAQVTQPNGVREGVMLYAMEDFAGWNLPWSVNGDDVTARDLRRGSYVLLDESARKRFSPYQVGDYREFINRRLRIIGTTNEARSFTTNPLAFADYSIAQQLDPTNLRDRTSYILVKLAPGADRESVRGHLRERLPNNDIHTREEWAGQSRSYWLESTGLGMNMMVTVFLGGLVGVVVVGQTLYTSTLDHIKEYATVKAIGGGNRAIFRVISEQAILGALVGYALGLAMTFSMVPILNTLDLWPRITGLFAFEVFVGTVVLCWAASALSFHKVAVLDPAMVFRS